MANLLVWSVNCGKGTFAGGSSSSTLGGVAGHSSTATHFFPRGQHRRSCSTPKTSSERPYTDTSPPRSLCFYAAYYQFTFSAAHIPGREYLAADAISRDNVPLFSSSFPQVQRSLVPQHIQDSVLLQPPDWSSLNWIAKFRLSLRTASPQRLSQPTNLV